MPKEEGAYTRSLEEVFHEAEQARGMPTREFHIVGGLHPKLRLSYYTDMIRGLKERHPEVHIKALTAVEIAHLARIEKISEREVLLAMKEAGLDQPAGRRRRGVQHGGAGHDRRAQAHGRGVDPGAPDRARARHSDELHHALRPRRDRRGPDRPPRHAARAAGRDRRFLTYIPLAYHPDNNELGEEMGRVGTATTGYEDLKNIAVGRLFLDNFPHVKTHWPMVTPFLSQIALTSAATTSRAPWCTSGSITKPALRPQMHMPYLELVRLIRGAGSGRSSATVCTTPCATSSTTRRPSPLCAAARRFRWCTPHEARSDPLDQLLPGLRRDRPRHRAACRRSSSPARRRS